MSQNSPQRWFNLEELFFANVDRQLMERLRKELAFEETAESIMQVTGITDAALAQEIAEKHITPETLAAFRLAPIVAVAWADDHLAENEQYVITRIAEKSGIEADSPAMKMIESWTAKRPPLELLETWVEYAKALCQSLSEGHRKALRSQILSQVKAVAQASGGVLQYGSLSPSETKVVESVEEALS